LRLNDKVIQMVRHFFEANKPVAAVCHGAQLLAAAGVLKDRHSSAYPACSPDVTLAGGRYADIGIDEAVTDGNLVTAPAWPAHPAWMSQFLQVLGTQITHSCCSNPAHDCAGIPLLPSRRSALDPWRGTALAVARNPAQAPTPTTHAQSLRSWRPQRPLSPCVPDMPTRHRPAN